MDCKLSSKNIYNKDALCEQLKNNLPSDFGPLLSARVTHTDTDSDTR